MPVDDPEGCADGFTVGTEADAEGGAEGIQAPGEPDSVTAPMVPEHAASAIVTNAATAARDATRYVRTKPPQGSRSVGTSLSRPRSTTPHRVDEFPWTSDARP